MIGPYRIEGYAIVSADGFIADSDGTMPDSIRNASDQKFLQTELDHAAVVVHGRHSQEGGPRAARRKRLIVTRRIATFAADPSHPHSLLWNPAGATFEAALAGLDVSSGTAAIIGGTEVFGMFLPFYDAFHLTRAAFAEIPGGRPLFPVVGVHPTQEDALAACGLTPGARRDIDAAAGITLTTWIREPAAKTRSP